MKTKIALALAIAMIPIMVFANEGNFGDKMMERGEKLVERGEKMSEKGENMMKRYFGSASSSNATSTLNVACINPAVDKRENALIAGHDTMNTGVKAALTARGTSLKAAYALDTQAKRKQARNASWEQFRTSVQAAHTAMRAVRSSAWNTFNADMKACGVSQSEKPMTIPLPAASL
jgi:hypothetical protein